MAKRETRLVVLLVAMLAIAEIACAETVERSGWVPNVGFLAAGEFPLGDMWTFQCPKGGFGTVFVDTKDDVDDGTSCLDAMAYVVDSTGTLIGVADDNAACTYPPVCGFSCPSFTFGPCDGNPHSLIVRDFGTATNTGQHCNKGGGYRLFLQVFDKNGVPRSAANIQLGGGASRNVPLWARLLLFGTNADQGPALDDEDVPNVPFVAGGAAHILTK